MKNSIILAGVLALVVAAPAQAQERGVSRRSFTFLDNTVTVEVTADMPGTLQIVRGEPGFIEVAGRVPGGVSAFALGGRDGGNLRITAAGGEQADFIVVVPEDAYVRVRLPNRKGGEVGSTRPGRFMWGDGNVKSSGAPFTLPAGGPALAHTSDHAPRVLNIPRLTAVRSISVRLEGEQFQVRGTKPMSVVNGSTENVEIRTSGEVEDLVVTVPQFTRDFTLKLGGRTALVMRGMEVTAYCEPVSEQELEGGRRWFHFTPQAGRVSCR